jgi:hypothetical protein
MISTQGDSQEFIAIDCIEDMTQEIPKQSGTSDLDG